MKVKNHFVVLFFCVIALFAIMLYSKPKNQDWYYTDYGDEILIEKYLGTDNEVIVPMKINNKLVTGISLKAFDDKPTKIILQEGIEIIYPFAFFEAKSVTSIFIPKTVIEIGYHAFNGASSLTEIIVDPENKNYSSENGVLFNKDKTTLYKYPEAKTDKSYTIPESVSAIYRGAFVQFKYHHGFLDGPKLENINVDEKNKHFSSTDGVLFNKDKTQLIKYPEWKQDKIYVVPETVELIDIIAFANSHYLEEVTLPSNIIEIDHGAFFAMKKINCIYLERSSQLGITKLNDGECFGESNKELIIYVQSDSLDEYINSENWNNYSKIIRIK